ncbi:hypothetical protein EVJ58_g7840 [Rhodofomes roseus]|uniref:Uncharacterized protein n=1 Tax=Rhodofomes roseus TaxID=34475 RepID=A0A4Y9Y2W1_9APHY|nr:hypothetical protein EVJ58_g7840 [Rhodofomes roseus]
MRDKNVTYRKVHTPLRCGHLADATACRAQSATALERYGVLTSRQLVFILAAMARLAFLLHLPPLRCLRYLLSALLAMSTSANQAIWTPEIRYVHTDALLTFLEQNEEHRKALIGDPGKQGDCRSGSKSGKMNRDLRYEVVFAIFSESPDATLRAKWASSHSDKGKWARIIESCMNDLRKKYREVIKELSGTGFGLRPEDHARGVAMVSDKALQDSKLQRIWFDCLALLYRDKLSVTVTAGTSMPGQDLVGQAYAVLGMQQRGGEHVDIGDGQDVEGVPQYGTGATLREEFLEDKTDQWGVSMAGWPSSDFNVGGPANDMTTQYPPSTFTDWLEGRDLTRPQLVLSGTNSAWRADAARAGSDVASVRSVESDQSRPGPSWSAMLALSDASSGEQNVDAVSGCQLKRTRLSANADRALAPPGLGSFNNVMQGVMENITTTQQSLNDIKLEQARQKTIDKEMVLIAQRTAMLRMEYEVMQLKIQEKTLEGRRGGDRHAAQDRTYGDDMFDVTADMDFSGEYHVDSVSAFCTEGLAAGVQEPLSTYSAPATPFAAAQPTPMHGNTNGPSFVNTPFVNTPFVKTPFVNTARGSTPFPSSPLHVDRAPVNSNICVSTPSTRTAPIDFHPGTPFVGASHSDAIISSPMPVHAVPGDHNFSDALSVDGPHHAMSADGGSAVIFSDGHYNDIPFIGYVDHDPPAQCHLLSVYTFTYMNTQILHFLCPSAVLLDIMAMRKFTLDDHVMHDQADV